MNVLNAVMLPPEITQSISGNPVESSYTDEECVPVNEFLLVVFIACEFIPPGKLQLKIS